MKSNISDSLQNSPGLYSPRGLVRVSDTRSADVSHLSKVVLSIMPRTAVIGPGIFSLRVAAGSGKTPNFAIPVTNAQRLRRQSARYHDMIHQYPERGHPALELRATHEFPHQGPIDSVPSENTSEMTAQGPRESAVEGRMPSLPGEAFLTNLGPNEYNNSVIVVLAFLAVPPICRLRFCF